MGTRFELVLDGEDEFFVRAVGEEAIEEIQTWHRKLNAFDKSSTISLINREATDHPVRIDSETFDLLVCCQTLWKATASAFDITIGPLMRAFGFRGDGVDPGETPVWGMQHLILDSVAQTIRFARPGMEIDLGGVAKGYALDCVAALLHQHGIERALVHGGTSSVLAIGAPPDQDGWMVGIANPNNQEAELARVCLNDRALGVSVPSGRIVITDSEDPAGHVLDPRTGTPSVGSDLAAIVSRSAATADAWATACVVLNTHPPDRAGSLSSLLASTSGRISLAGPDCFTLIPDTHLQTD